MIILFSLMVGITISSHKRKQIRYIEDLIFLGERIILFMNSTLPDTNVLFSKLQAEPRFQKYNVSEIYKSSPLPEYETTQAKELMGVIGRYDAQTQIRLTEEFTGYYKALKKQYQEHYDSHSRLYIVFSVSAGSVLALMLI